MGRLLASQPKLNIRYTHRSATYPQEDCDVGIAGNHPHMRQMRGIGNPVILWERRSCVYARGEDVDSHTTPVSPPYPPSSQFIGANLCHLWTDLLIDGGVNRTPGRRAWPASSPRAGSRACRRRLPGRRRLSTSTRRPGLIADDGDAVGQARGRPRPATSTLTQPVRSVTALIFEPSCPGR